jgi:rare lipoprotein A
LKQLGLIGAAVATLLCCGCASVPAASTNHHAHAAAQRGLASIYAYKGGRTASGQRATPGGLTAAHRSLPFGTKVLVTNSKNGRSVTVQINDRGPFIRGRVIDVTPAAARALGFSGLAQVSLSVVKD